MEPPAAAARASCRRRPLLCLLLAALCMPPGERPFREGLVGGEAGAAGGRAPRVSRPSVRPSSRPPARSRSARRSPLPASPRRSMRGSGLWASEPPCPVVAPATTGKRAGEAGAELGLLCPQSRAVPSAVGAQRSAARGGSGGTGGCSAPQGAPRPPLVPGALQPSGVRRLYFVNIELESEV